MGPAMFIHHFEKETLQKPALPGAVACVSQPLAKRRRSSKASLAGGWASGKEDTRVGGPEVARVGRNVPSLFPGLWLSNVPGLEGLHSPKESFSSLLFLRLKT